MEASKTNNSLAIKNNPNGTAKIGAILTLVLSVVTIVLSAMWGFNRVENLIYEMFNDGVVYVTAFFVSGLPLFFTILTFITNLLYLLGNQDLKFQAAIYGIIFGGIIGGALVISSKNK